MRAIAAPFAVCYRSEPDGPVVLATDSAGLRHVYVWQGPDWAAMSSSSLLLSTVVGAPLDEAAIGVYALVGNYLLDQTPFTGIRKIDAGVACSMRAGRIDPEVFEAQDPVAPVGSGGRAGQAARGVTVMRDVVGACLEAYPDASLELSGGFDSRAVLAAIPHSQRRGRMALTIGVPGDPDIRVARELAAFCELDHRVVDLNGLDRLSPDEVLALVRGRPADATPRPTRSPPACSTGWAVRSNRDPRLNGANAEFGRANFYPGNRAQDEVTDRVVERLARWRVMENHGTDPVVLSDEFTAAARDATMTALKQDLRGYGVDWLRALDEYYFLSRVQRWAGIEYTGSGHDRVVLSPFTHPRYVDWVRRCDPRDRRASKVFASTFDLLDPGPGGHPPAQRRVTPRDRPGRAPDRGEAHRRSGPPRRRPRSGSGPGGCAGARPEPPGWVSWW